MKKDDSDIKATTKKAPPKKTATRVSSRKKTEDIPEPLTAEDLVNAKLKEIEVRGEVKDEKPKKEKRKKLTPSPIASIQRFFPELSVGLTDEQVATRKTQDLVNKVDTKYSKSYKSIIFGNLFTFFNLLCIICAAALIYVGAEFSNLFFLLIFSANLAIGIIQEIKAKLSIEKLSLLSSPVAKVIRNGLQTEIPIGDIVLDDVLILSLGNQVVTDCFLAEGVVEVNESLLTGESMPVKKEIGDIIYAGSFISAGTCIVRADKVGKDNYIESLTAKAKSYKKPASELMRTLKTIITVIGIIIVPIAVLTFRNNYLNTIAASEWEAIRSAVIKTSSVVIGMIPAGMFLLTSVALAVGVIRLSKINTLVQDLYSLEMLARVDVLCLDKTGTITDGRMTVSDCIVLDKKTDYSVNDIIGSMLNSLGDNNQTSIALYNYFGHNSIYKPNKIVPFSSKKKFSSVSFSDIGTFYLGAPEFVLKTMPEKVDKLVKHYTSMGLRVISLAYTPTIVSTDKIPLNLRPTAIITIADNIREDAISTISWFKENDVEVKIISGDNPITVSEVAKRVGVKNAQNYISLEGFSDNDIIGIATKYTVFGRVSPEQKATLVKALKAQGKTVAMTGDGVNDILALKEADCAVTVASGSDAARNVSHLVLMNNDFSSMPKVVHEGRRVINNIQKSSSLYLMKTIFTFVFAVISLIKNTAYPFSPSNMIILEVIVIGLPSFFLSLQPDNNRVHGKFITHVSANALQGAILMIINVLIVQFSYEKLGYDNLTYVTLSTIVITYAGFVSLFRLCQPFNGFRAIMYSLMFAISLFWVFYLKHTFFNLSPLMPFADYWQYILIALCVILADIPISEVIYRLINKLKSLSEKKNV